MTPPGMILQRSPHDGPATAKLVEQAIEAQNLKLFARVSHDSAAAAIGLCMPFTCVLIFGSPRAGTPLMKCTPTLALDLPTRILVWEGDDGEGVWLCANDPDWIAARHGMLPEAAPQFDAMKRVLSRIIDAVAGLTA